MHTILLLYMIETQTVLVPVFRSLFVCVPDLRSAFFCGTLMRNSSFCYSFSGYKNNILHVQASYSSKLLCTTLPRLYSGKKLGFTCKNYDTIMRKAIVADLGIILKACSKPGADGYPMHDWWVLLHFVPIEMWRPLPQFGASKSDLAGQHDSN